jgi:hypothetical protein
MLIKDFSIDTNLVSDNKKNFCIDLENKKFFWSFEKSTWHFSNQDSSLDILLKISCLDFDLKSIIPAKYFKIISELNINKNDLIQWNLFLSENDRKIFAKDLYENLRDKIAKLNLKNIEYFQDVFPKRLNVLNLFTEYNLNYTILNKYIGEDTNLSNIAILKSFDNSTIEYNNFGTKTGRLTVKSGGNILNLKRSYRNIFQSSYENGKIFSIDFSSLEVRLFLLEMGKNISGDIYQKISATVNGVVPRDIVKKIVISMIYGAAIETLQKTLQDYMEHAEGLKFLNKIKDLFNTEELLSRLTAEAKLSGKITNKFGRCVKLDGDYDNGVLLNYYFQSSGADFCLITFNDFLDSINFDLKPLFVIHDSLVVDVAPENFEKLSSIQNIRSDFYDYNFPIKIEEFY